MNVAVRTFRPTILMVDDDEALLASVARALSGYFTIVTRASAKCALEWLMANKTRPHAIVADLVMPEMDGIQFLQQARKIVPDVVRILLSGNVSSVSLRDAVNRAMVSRILAKPVSVRALKMVLDRFISNAPFLSGHAVSPALINRAIKNGGQKIVAQRRVHAQDFSLAGAEILTRFPGLQKRFSLEQIFEACEDHPVINLLTSGMFEMVDQAAPELDARFGNADKGARISVNLSPCSVINSNFVRFLARTAENLREKNLILEFEITERNARVLSSEFITNARYLKAEGIALYIDDFGAGNNSIALLRHDFFSGIKLDRELTWRMMTESLDESFVEWTVSVARQQGLVVVAEGVEDRATANRLRMIGVDEMQGYFFGYPASLDPAIEDDAWQDKEAPDCTEMSSSGCSCP
ncbi:MAG: EAL domain-containing protein [Pseudomonadota bacterium]